MTDRSLFEGAVGWYWIPDSAAPSNLAAITQTEIGAGSVVDFLGTHGGEAMFDGSGWEPSVSSVQDDDWANKDQITIDTTVSHGVGTLRWKYSEDAHPIYTNHVEGEDGVIVLAFDNDTGVGKTYEAWEVKMSIKTLDKGRGVKSWTGNFSISDQANGAFAA